jgi:hypothetical protein
METPVSLEHLIVEHTYAEPMSDDELGRLSRRLDDCLAQHGARWLRSYLSADHRRMVCEFEAPDAEAVRVSYRSAGIAFEKAWTAEVFTRDDA